MKGFGNVAGLLLAWVLLFFGFGYFKGGAFISLETVEQIFRQSTVVALAGIGIGGTFAMRRTRRAGAGLAPHAD